MRTFFILKQTFVNKFSIVVSLTCTPAPLCNNAGIGILLIIVSSELAVVSVFTLTVHYWPFTILQHKCASQQELNRYSKDDYKKILQKIISHSKEFTTISNFF